MRSQNFLDFNGTNVTILLNDGQWYIAIKPICEALGIAYKHHSQYIREHKIYSQLGRLCESVAADGKMRKMLCLPETLIYGWLANINSDNEDLVKYQMECHKILFDHFRGAMTDRIYMLTEKNEALEHISQCKSKLLDSPEYKEIITSQRKIKQLERSLRMMDKDLVSGQQTLDIK